MTGVITATPIAELVPLGNGYFRGERQTANRIVRFVVRLTPNGRVLVSQASERATNPVAA